jgi:predicted acylesterase/phospholipase RssA
MRYGIDIPYSLKATMMVKLSIQNVVYPIRSHLRLIQNFIVFTLSIALLSTSKRLFTPMSGISRLVFSGGGVKGVIYPGVYRALDETGLLSTMTQVSGSSIGSVVAGFLAVGMTSNEFRDALLPIQLNELLGTTTWSFFKKNPPGCFPTSKTGFPFEQWVRVHLISTVNRFLLTSDTSTVPELDELKNRLMNDNQASFTFADLDLLNKYFPKKFKKAIIIATHYPEATLAIFNSKTTPQVDIAKAIRASSSLPILLVPAEINGTMYIDGGVLDNVPTNYFEEESNSLHPTHTQKDSTLILAFKDKSNPKDDPLCRALDQSSLKYSKSLLYKPDWYDKFTLDLLLGRLIGVRFNEQVTKSIDNSFQRIRMDYPFRTVALPSGGDRKSVV